MKKMSAEFPNWIGDFVKLDPGAEITCPELKDGRPGMVIRNQSGEPVELEFVTSEQYNFVRWKDE